MNRYIKIIPIGLGLTGGFFFAPAISNLIDINGIDSPYLFVSTTIAFIILALGVIFPLNAKPVSSPVVLSHHSADIDRNDSDKDEISFRWYRTDEEFSTQNK